MNPQEFLGKHLLIGITFIDGDEKPVEQFQTHGVIIAANDDEGIVIQKADGSGTYAIPPDFDNVDPAPPGVYELKNSGEIVENPDYTSTWVVRKPKEMSAEEQKNSISNDKKSGYKD